MTGTFERSAAQLWPTVAVGLAGLLYAIPAVSLIGFAILAVG